MAAGLRGVTAGCVAAVGVGARLGAPPSPGEQAEPCGLSELCALLLQKAAAVRMLAAGMRPVMQCRVRVSSRAVTCPRRALLVSPVPGAACCECLLRKMAAPCEACY